MRLTLSLPSTLLSLCLCAAPALACDGPAALQQLQARESQTLLKNAPSFRHGWDDGHIQLRFGLGQASADGCTASMQLELPQADLDEVNAYLEQHPAKRILLGAQGYAVPEQRLITVDYRYLLDDGGKVSPHNEGNKPLNDLHHSIEFMYQLLAQTRAEVNAESANSVAWPAAARAEELKRCAQTLKSERASIEAACSCRVDKLATKLSARQMELVDFLLDQPYSTATGALIGYTEQSKAINHGCGLAKRQGPA